MKINERQLYDVTSLDLQGKFILGEDRQFGELLDYSIDNGVRKLIVNLGNVEYVDSTGLGQLISGYLAMQRVEGHLKLLHIKENLMKLLVVTKLFTVFETFDSESAAISSFTSDQKQPSSLPETRRMIR